MKSTLAAIAFLWCACSLTAQSPPASTEVLDLSTISRIREEGITNSRVLEYGSGLADGVGARLTGSPDFYRATQWTISQLKQMGVANAHRESWGDFGMAWTQIGTSLLLAEPSSATLAAQATPWSPATNGEVAAGVVLVPEITSEAGLEEWKGKLTGKIILYGTPDPINANPELRSSPWIKHG